MARLLLLLLLTQLSLNSIVMACPPALNHTFHTLDGQVIDLCQFAGKVVLAVNTASHCGNTPQYRGLQSLFDKYRDRGLMIIGFPANDFAGQEPGTSTEIKDFCETQYGVKFPMLEKTSVVPGKANAVFAELTRITGAAPEWNFHKYLLARDGVTAYSFPARTQPTTAEIVTRIEQLLEQGK
jgi:glutathione peroxidase